MVMHHRGALPYERAPRANQGLGGVLLAIILCLPFAVSCAQQPAAALGVDPLAEITHALRAQQFATALERSTQALRTSPGDPRLWTFQAMSYEGLHRTTDALVSFRKALGIAPDYLPALEGAAQLSYATHNPHTEELLQRLIRLHPEDQVAHAMLGELSIRKGDCPGAVANFAKATDAIAQRSEVLMQYSSCLVQMSRFEEAAAVLKQLVVLLPNDESVHYDLALAEFRAGHTEESNAALEPVLAWPTPVEDDLTLGAEIAESQGQTQKALDLLRRAILLYPKEESAYLDFVNLAYQHASMQVGLDVVNIGLKQMPKAAELYFARGVLLCQLGKVDEGFADFGRANQLDPKLSFVGVAEGIAQSQSHHTAAALSQFRADVKAHPEDALAWYLLAEALSQQGYARGTQGFDEALRATKRATQLNTKRADAEDLLATMYLQTDEVQPAITASRAALAIDPGDTQALYHLVLAVRKTDEKKELPELVKRLMEARRQEAAKTEKSRPHTLVEASPDIAAEPK